MWPGSNTRFYPGIYPRSGAPDLDAAYHAGQLDDWWGGVDRRLYRETKNGRRLTHLGIKCIFSSKKIFSSYWHRHPDGPFDYANRNENSPLMQDPDARVNGQPVYDWSWFDAILALPLVANGECKVLFMYDDQGIRDNHCAWWVTQRMMMENREHPKKYDWVYARCKMDFLKAWARRYAGDPRIAALELSEYAHLENEGKTCGYVVPDQFWQVSAENGSFFYPAKAMLEADPGLMIIFTGPAAFTDRYFEGVGTGLGLNDLPGVQCVCLQDIIFFSGTCGDGAPGTVDCETGQWAAKWLCQQALVRHDLPVMVCAERNGWRIGARDRRVGAENPWNIDYWPNEDDPWDGEQEGGVGAYMFPDPAFWLWYCSGRPRAEGAAADSGLGQPGADPPGVIPAVFYDPTPPWCSTPGCASADGQFSDSWYYGNLSRARYRKAFRMFGPSGTKAMFNLPKGYEGETASSVRVRAGSDDAEERLDTGAVSLSSSDLELVRDSADQLVGLRFVGVDVPRNALIEEARLTFVTDETGSEATQLRIRAQAADNPATFTSTAGNLSARPRTAASVSWAPEAWNTIGRSNQSPDIAAVVQEIVDRPDWSSGNALAILISGNGRRVAKAYDGQAAAAPLLYIGYREAPAIAVSATNIFVSAPQGEDCPDATFQVWNGLYGLFEYSVVEATSKFSVWPVSAASDGPAEKCTHTISFNTADLLQGTYERTIRIEDNGSGPRNGPVTILVRIEIGPPPPAAPAGLAAAGLSATAAHLTWRDLSDEDRYMLRTSLDGEHWYALDAVYPAADTTQYVASGLTPNTVYYFKLRGINESGYGPYCEPIRVVTPRPDAGTFTAYNDLCWDATQPAARITAITRAESGLLMDHDTGEYIPVTLTINAGGGRAVEVGADPAARTEAASVFGGIVDCRGVLDYATSELTFTVAGLSSARRYELTLFGNRANTAYTARTTPLTLEGADGSVNTSSAGVTVQTALVADDTTVIVNGFNTVKGLVARYDQIEPGADGEIRVRVPAWSGTGDAGRSYLNALRLRTVEPPAPTLPQGAVWRYRKGSAEASGPPAAWRQPGFDASRWAQGAAPIGYGAPAVGGTVLSDMRGNYTSIFLRRTFHVADPPLVAAIAVQIRYDDGFILWLNGREVARANMPGEPGSLVPCSATAGEADSGTRGISLCGTQLPELAVGLNVIAAQVFNCSLRDSSDCVFDASLDLIPAATSRTADADGNRLPDAWETAHLAGLADPSDRADSGDPDADGLSNLQEWIVGSDPQSAAHREDGRLLSVAPADGRLVVSLHTVAAAGAGYEALSRRYALEEAPLQSAEWRAVPGCTNIPGTGRIVAYTVPDTTEPRVYRARVWLETAP
ncbi:MAG: fibronectin type III domain-containing protein [Kiritimatiellae bacterium]|nr:fibronectin type III domain-containing protein [Kiritimatiellia bacterium]